MKQFSAAKVQQSENTRPVRTVRPVSPELEEEIDLAELLGALVEKRWQIGAVTALVATLGAVYALVATPIYRADALVQVEEKSGGLAELKDLSAMFSGETPTEAEIQLIRSRLVLGPVVEQLRLDISAEPRYFPLFGRAWARRNAGSSVVAEPFLGLSMFAWGGERIQVERLEVPRTLEDEPLTLVAGDGGHFELFGPSGTLLIEGKVGETASSGPLDTLQETGPFAVELFVTELRARPGTKFRLVKMPRGKAVKTLQEELAVSERGKKTGIIALALDGPGPERITAVLNTIMAVYQRQNVERKSAEAEKTLEFVTGQLPVLKENLEAAEAALNAYRTKRGTVDLGLEAKAIIEKAAEAETKLTELELQYAEARQRFTESHPTISALRKQMDQLRAEKGAIDARMKNLPEAELASFRLTRDVTVANELYLLLLNKAQELRVVKSGTLGNVRLIDSAEVQFELVSPKRAAIVVLSLMLGVALGVTLVFVQRTLRKGVEDPELIEQELGISVYASVPHSPRQQTMLRAGKNGRKRALAPLALQDPTDLAIESLRSLRTSLQFTLAEAATGVIAVGGPRPGIGKSFVSVNLAHVLADAGKRVLLVDADIRRGEAHRYFGLERTRGLSELICGEATLDEVVHSTQATTLSFITTGALPPNPSELLASTRFHQLVKEMSERFDIVLLDTPPILAVTDAALIAQTAGVNLMVLKAGLHPMRELALAVNRLEQSGVRLTGFILNDISLHPGASGADRYHFQYEYK